MITRTTGVSEAAKLPAVPFDATHGHSVAELMSFGAPADPPADFDAVWAGVRADVLGIDPAAAVRPWREVDGPTGPTQVAEVRLTSWLGVRLRGWLVRTSGELRRGVVMGHGYGGRDAPDLALPDGCLSLQLVARGLPGSEVTGIGTTGATHVLSGIGSFLGYSHTGAVADQWVATSVLQSLAPDVPIGYQGGSFGGGIGVLAAAFEDRWDAVQVTVPSFGNHPLRLGLRCTGSGEAVRTYAATHPGVLGVLRYVDAATAATRVRVPVLCVAAAADPAVPPPGQFAIATSFAGPTWLHVQPAGHAEWPGCAEDLAESARNVAEFWSYPDGAVWPR